MQKNKFVLCTKVPARRRRRRRRAQKSASQEIKGAKLHYFFVYIYVCLTQYSKFTTSKRCTFYTLGLLLLFKPPVRHDKRATMRQMELRHQQHPFGINSGTDKHSFIVCTTIWHLKKNRCHFKASKICI